MKTFNLYRHPELGLEAVKEGFSWPAFFFGILWMVYKKLWKYAGIWFAIYITLAFVENAVKSGGVDSGMKATYDIMILMGYLLIMLIPAFKGNSWRQTRLLEKGYVLEKTVKASTPDQAQQAGQSS